MTENELLTNSMGNLMISDSMSGVIAEYGELGIDKFLEEGVIRDIPIVNTLVALGKLGISVNDRLLARKILTYLTTINELTPEERLKMVERLESDEKYGRKVGEHLIELLDRVESNKKPEMIGAVFKAFAKDRINLEMLQSLCDSIERLPLFQIRKLREFRKEQSLYELLGTTTCHALVTAGLAHYLSAASGIAYRPNEVFDAFLSLDLHKT